MFTQISAFFLTVPLQAATQRCIWPNLMYTCSALFFLSCFILFFTITFNYVACFWSYVGNVCVFFNQAARARGVDCVVAPYEADAQLAYLTKCGLAQAVITEDSDLLAFGCKKVSFNCWDWLECVRSLVQTVMSFAYRVAVSLKTLSETIKWNLDIFV